MHNLDNRFKRMTQLTDTLGRRKRMNTITLQGALAMAENCILPRAESFHGFMQSSAIPQAQAALQ